MRDVTGLQRRTLRVSLVAQTPSGAGLSAGIVVGALLAQAPMTPIRRRPAA